MNVLYSRVVFALSSLSVVVYTHADMIFGISAGAECQKILASQGVQSTWESDYEQLEFSLGMNDVISLDGCDSTLYDLFQQYESGPGSNAVFTFNNATICQTTFAEMTAWTQNGGRVHVAKQCTKSPPQVVIEMYAPSDWTWHMWRSWGHGHFDFHNFSYTPYADDSIQEKFQVVPESPAWLEEGRCSNAFNLTFSSPADAQVCYSSLLSQTNKTVLGACVNGSTVVFGTVKYAGTVISVNLTQCSNAMAAQSIGVMNTMSNHYWLYDSFTDCANSVSQLQSFGLSGGGAFVMCYGWGTNIGNPENMISVQQEYKQFNSFTAAPGVSLSIVGLNVGFMHVSDTNLAP